MIYPPGATSISCDVMFCDDSGFPLTGKVASDFPVVKWSGGANTADTTITLSDLAAITTAHPNDNTAGGVKEREGGVYRLDLPNNMFTAAGKKALTFAETTNKRFIVIGGNCFDVQYVQSDVEQWKAGTIPAVNVTGVPKVDVVDWLGTAPSTPTVAGVPNVNAKTWNDLATVALPLVPTVAGRTLDVAATGEAGLDFNNILSSALVTLHSLTITNALTASNASNSVNLGTDSIGSTQLAASAVTEIHASDADTSGVTTLLSRLSATRAGYLDNLSAGAVALASNLTGDPYAYLTTNMGALGANLTAADDAVMSRLGAPTGASIAADIATRLATSGYTTPPTAAANATAVWTDLLAGSDFSTLSSIGKLLKDDIDATISSRLASASYTTPPTVGAIADQVWDEDLTGHTTNLSAGQYIGEIDSSTNVLNTVYDGLNGLLYVNVLKAAGTDWNSGAIGASTLASNTITAAKIATDAITSNGLAASAVSEIHASDADTSGVTTLLGRVTATRAGYWDNLSAGVVPTAAQIATAVLASTIETGVSLTQSVRAIAAAAAGKRSNALTASEQFDAIGNPGTARIIGNMDSSGNGTPTLSL